MKRIFCDRCGEEIDYRGRSKQVDIVGAGVGTYDMCPQCMLEFRAFMKSKPQQIVKGENYELGSN